MGNLLDVVDSCGGRSLVQELPEDGQFAGGAHCLDFHPAIAEIADSTRKPELLGDSGCPPPKANSLHATAQPKGSVRFRVFFVRRRVLLHLGSCLHRSGTVGSLRRPLYFFHGLLEGREIDAI